MIITARNLAKSIFEDVMYEKGPCIYPGSYKPPHLGYFEAVKDLASRNYIDEVFIVISAKEKNGITAHQSLQVWKTFLQCDPIPKVNVEVAPYTSPVEYAYKFIEARPNQKPIYLAGEEGDEESQNYFKSLQKRFGDQVLTIAVNNGYENINDDYVLEVLKTGNYEKFKKCVPEAVNSKGKTQDLFKLLSPTVKESTKLYESEIGQEGKIQQIEKFVDYCCDLLEIERRPSIEPIADSNFPKQNYTFGHYAPDENQIAVYVNNRNLADILRTLAHELVHHKQNELGMIDFLSGATGSDIENEANAVAAMIMREYGKKNPNIYE